MIIQKHTNIISTTLPELPKYFPLYAAHTPAISILSTVPFILSRFSMYNFVIGGSKFEIQQKYAKPIIFDLNLLFLAQALQALYVINRVNFNTYVRTMQLDPVTAYVVSKTIILSLHLLSASQSPYLTSPAHAMVLFCRLNGDSTFISLNFTFFLSYQVLKTGIPLMTQKREKVRGE